jgi:HemY protein
MAELERSEHNDEGRAREWIARALNAAPDPAWTAEGHVSDRWLPMSPSGRLDAFEWRVPVTGIARGAAPIEPAARPIAPVPAAPEATTDDRGERPPAALAAPSASDPAHEPAEDLPAGTGRTPDPAGPVVKAAPAQRDPVIPLLHAPDDPGPDAADETTPPVEPQHNGGWRRIFE